MFPNTNVNIFIILCGKDTIVELLNSKWEVKLKLVDLDG